MTKKSWFVLGACAVVGAVTAMRRRATDVGAQAERETERCARLFRRLDAKVSHFR